MKKKLLAYLSMGIGAAMLGAVALPYVAEASCWRPYATVDDDGNDGCRCLKVHNSIGFASCFVVYNEWGGSQCVTSFPCTGSGPVPQ